MLLTLLNNINAEYILKKILIIQKKMKTKPLWIEFAFIKAVPGVEILRTPLRDYF